VQVNCLYVEVWVTPVFVVPLVQTTGVAKTRQQKRANKKRQESQSRKLAAQNHAQTLWPESPCGDASGLAGNGEFNAKPADRLAAPSTSGVGNDGAGQTTRSPAELAELAETRDLLMQSAVQLSNAGPQYRQQFASLVDRLVDLDGILAAEPMVLGRPPVARPEAILSGACLELVPWLWENGWQPLDLVHVVRKERNPRVARLAGVLVHAEAAGYANRAAMPNDWADQLAAIPRFLNPDALAKAPLSKWRTYEQISLSDALNDSLLLLGLLKVLPRLTVLCEPPSQWASSASPRGSGGTASGAGSTGAQRPQGSPGSPGSPGFTAGVANDGEMLPDASAKTMATIRALLAKAEATTFEAEREAFAAKAQDLMTRYSIDAALLDERHGDQLGAGVRKRRFHLDNPYATEKCHLLNTVARLNNVKIVYEDRFATATAIGFPTDIELTDLLFTSLLVQAAQGLHDLVAAAGKGRTSSPAFRRAYWIAYGVRIGERLTEAQAQATQEAEAVHGGALVLVMKEREEAVSSVTADLFKNTTKMKSRRLDADGWDAGRSAAGNANLGTPKARLRS
jgi:Protein of unknown function (DUF2786)